MSIYRTGILGLLICSPLFLSASEDGARQPIRFAPLPMEGRQILHEPFFGLVSYLQAFHRGDVDLAYFCSQPYTPLDQIDAEVEPVVCFREADGLSQTTQSQLKLDPQNSVQYRSAPLPRVAP